MKEYVLAEDGTRVYVTAAESAEGDAIDARYQRWCRKQADEHAAFEQEARALHDRILARAAAKAKAEEDDE